MSGRQQPQVKGTLRSKLFGAAVQTATEVEVEAATEAAIDAALAPYDDDPDPPMIGFRESMDDIPEDDDCPICRSVNAEYAEPSLVPLPDGTVLEIRRRRVTGATARA